MVNVLAGLAQNLPMPDFAPVPTVPVPPFQEEPTNVMQAAVAPPPPPPSPPPQAPQMNAAQPPRRERRSLIDTIGRVADVLARVGGAEALYQPTLDAREDRALGMEDRQRKIQADEIALATGKFALGDVQNTRVGQVARGVKALAKTGADATQAWTALASRMQLDPATIESVGQAIAADPNALDGLIAATTDPKYDQAKYGGSVVYGTDANGNLVAYQPGLGNEGGRNVLPEGITPIDPVKFVDTGGAQVGYGSRSGNTQRILPKTEKPGAVADRRLRRYTVDANNRTRREIADMKEGDDTKQGDVSAILQDFGIKLTGKEDPVADLIKGSTSGYVQNVASMVPGALGIATEGKEKISRLETIDNALVLALAGGKLGAGVSNADRDFFKEMSGKISDPNRPANQRIAAWEQIKGRLRGIQQRDAAKAAPKSAPRRTPARSTNSGGWKVLGVN